MRLEDALNRRVHGWEKSFILLRNQAQPRNINRGTDSSLYKINEFLIFVIAQRVANVWWFCKWYSPRRIDRVSLEAENFGTVAWNEAFTDQLTARSLFESSMRCPPTVLLCFSLRVLAITKVWNTLVPLENNKLLHFFILLWHFHCITARVSFISIIQSQGGSYEFEHVWRWMSPCLGLTLPTHAELSVVLENNLRDPEQRFTFWQTNLLYRAEKYTSCRREASTCSPQGWAIQTWVWSSQTEASRSFLLSVWKANESVGLQSKLGNAIELRDGIDLLCTGSTYPIFLKKLVPVFTKLLEGPPVFLNTSWEHVSLIVTATI